MSNVDGVVIYTDGSARMGGAGYGFHGYTYQSTPMDKLAKGMKVAIPTATGYVTKDKHKLENTVTVIDVIEGWGTCPDDKTNNHGEILGFKNALTYLQSLPALPAKVRLILDSQYVIESITKHLPKWRERNWRTTNGGEVKHRSKWEEIDLVYQKLLTECPDFEIVWTKAHVGTYGNELADELAKLGSGSRKDVAYCVSTPYEDWLASFEDIEKIPPLVMRGRLLFETGKPLGDKYYIYHLKSRSKGSERNNDTFAEKAAKKEAYLGTWIGDQLYSVVIPKEPLEVASMVVDQHNEDFFTGFSELATLRLDMSYREKYVALMRRLGLGCHYTLPATLANIGYFGASQADSVVSRTLRPPLRAYDALQSFETLGRLLGHFKEKGSIDGFTTVDITGLFFEETMKKKKPVWGLKAEITPQTQYVDVSIPVENTVFKTRLVFGSDIPDRTSFNRLADAATKVTLNVERVGIQFNYNVIIDSPDGIGIYSSPDKLVFVAKVST